MSLLNAYYVVLVYCGNLGSYLGINWLRISLWLQVSYFWLWGLVFIRLLCWILFCLILDREDVIEFWIFSLFSIIQLVKIFRANERLTDPVDCFCNADFSVMVVSLMPSWAFLPITQTTLLQSGLPQRYGTPMVTSCLCILLFSLFRYCISPSRWSMDQSTKLHESFYVYIYCSLLRWKGLHFNSSSPWWWS